MDNQLESLIRRLARLPGLGPRSARRAALFLLQNRDRLMLPLAEELGQVARSVRNCAECGNLDNADICGICRDPQRDLAGDLWLKIRGLRELKRRLVAHADRGPVPEELHQRGSAGSASFK